jgi:tetratricopeptide (TPR) repeat protein
MSTRSTRRSAGLLCILAVIAALSGCTTSPQAKEAKYLKRGEALLAKKDYPRALLEFRNAAAVMPKDAEPHYQMGLAYLGTADRVMAARAFRQAAELNPKHAGAQLKMAEIMASTSDQKLIAEAATRLQGVFGASPANPEAIDALALTEWKLGKREEAAQSLEGALKKFPAHLASAVQLARMKLAGKDWDGAEAVLKRAAADAPQSSPAAMALGEFYVSTGQPEKAELELKRAVQLDPKNGPALIGLARIQVAAKKMDEAEQTYRQASALPDNAYKPLHAMFVYESGKPEAAVEELQKLVKSAPNDRGLRTKLVQAYIGTNRIPEAEEMLSGVLKRNNKDTDALLQRAELRLRAGKTTDAQTDLAEVLHFTPDSAPAHFLLARVYSAEGQPQRQRQELLDTLRLNGDLLQARLILGTSLLAAGQAKTALEIIDQAPEPQKTQAPWMLGHNWAELSAGNIPEAEAGIDRVLREGRTPEAVLQGAVLRFVQRDYVGARPNLEELLKGGGAVDPNVARLLMQTYAARQEVAKGLDRLQEIAAAKPPSAPLQLLLGDWYNSEGNSAAARRAYESAKTADPKFAPATLAVAQMDLQEGHVDAARQSLRTVIASDPKNVPALMLAARADDAAGGQAGEIARYRAVLDLDHSNPVAMNNLAYKLVAEDPDQALKLAQQAAEMAPDSPSVQDTLGWIYYRKGLYSMAVPFLKTAVEKESNPRRQFHLGMTYLKAGDRAQGQKILREALQKDPNLAKTEANW